MIRVTNIDIENLNFGIQFCGDYSTVRIWTGNRELDMVMEHFMILLDSLKKVNKIIEDSGKLLAGNLDGNCIGENEAIISLRAEYFQFYNVSLGEGIYLELEPSIRIAILKKMKTFMESQIGKIYIVEF